MPLICGPNYDRLESSFWNWRSEYSGPTQQRHVVLLAVVAWAIEVLLYYVAGGHCVYVGMGSIIIGRHPACDWTHCVSLMLEDFTFIFIAVELENPFGAKRVIGRLCVSHSDE